VTYHLSSKSGFYTAPLDSAIPGIFIVPCGPLVLKSSFHHSNCPSSVSPSVPHSESYVLLSIQRRPLLHDVNRLFLLKSHCTLWFLVLSQIPLFLYPFSSICPASISISPSAKSAPLTLCPCVRHFIHARQRPSVYTSRNSPCLCQHDVEYQVQTKTSS
jgi:hypothetical protein